MDWLNKNWEREDKVYASKRRVNNKGSRVHPHIIGSFYSYRNKRTVEYESLNERIFYYFLELDGDVHRYYVQPIEVRMETEDGDWFHIPDVLVFRQGYPPLLYQVKESESDNLEPKNQLCSLECEKIAALYGWKYIVVFPKTLPSPLSRNISFLSGYLRTRSYYSDWYDQVVYRLRCIGPCTVEHLSSSFSDSIDPLFIKPLVFHLIAIGHFTTDVRQIICSESTIKEEARFTLQLFIPRTALAGQ